MDLRLQPSPFRGVGVNVEAQALAVLLAEYEALVKRMGACCMTAEHYEHAQAVIAEARQAAASVRGNPPTMARNKR